MRLVLPLPSFSYRLISARFKLIFVSYLLRLVFAFLPIKQRNLNLIDVNFLISVQFTGDIVGNFVQRVTTQLNHIRHLLRTIFDVVSTQQIPTKGELTRDAFGLNTIIVVLTTSGKVNKFNTALGAVG